MKNFTTFRRSRIHLIWAVAGVVAMAGVAVAQQICPTLPSLAFQFAPVNNSLKGAPIPLPKQLDTVIKDRQMAIVLAKRSSGTNRQAATDRPAGAAISTQAPTVGQSTN